MVITRPRLRLGIVSGVTLGLLITGLPEPPPVAQARDCPRSGGVRIARPYPDRGDFRFAGGGWGHGVGMSQYGAQGAAKLGCSAKQILRTYYRGASVQRVRTPHGLRVSLATGARSERVTAAHGRLRWELCGSRRCRRVGGVQDEGRTWKVTANRDGSYSLKHGGRRVWRGGDRHRILQVELGGTSARIARLASTGYRYRWGTLELDSLTGGHAYVTLRFRRLSRYLYGLGEVPSSWLAQALRAQAIAGRTYALDRRRTHRGRRSGCRCDVYATVRDQNFVGYEKAAEPVYGRRWLAAVNATGSGDDRTALVVRYRGRLAETYYSSSHGGFSESSAFVWGSPVPYLRPVDDRRWDHASDNPLRSWTRRFRARALGRALGVGRATRVRLPAPRGAGGRVGDPARGAGGFVVWGTRGRRTLSGDSIRSTLGLYSTLFRVRAARRARSGSSAEVAGRREAAPAPTDLQARRRPGPCPLAAGSLQTCPPTRP